VRSQPTKEFKLKLISPGKFLVYSLTGVVISFAGGICAGIVSDSGMIAVLFVLVFSIASFYFAHQVASTISRATISETAVQLNNQNILFESIAGYFIDGNVTMSAINLKLKSNAVFTITGAVMGRYGKQFKEFIIELKEALHSKSELSEELTFADVHPKRAISRKIFNYVILPLTVILNLFALYSFIAFRFLPWQILLIDSSVLGMVPLLKRKNKLLNGH